MFKKICSSLALLLLLNSVVYANTSATAARPELRALKTAQKITIDGVLDEPVWAKAVKYELAVPKDFFLNLPAEIARDVMPKLNDHGQVMAAWDDEYLYLAFNFQDADILVKESGDQKKYFLTSDVAEVFMMPEGKKYYWEMYITPQGDKTSYFLTDLYQVTPESLLNPQINLTAAAKVNGTLNDSKDHDKSWTAELSIPWNDLAKYSDPVGTNGNWIILIGRYNFSNFLKYEELSSYPRLNQTNWHYFPGYAKLVLEQ